MEPVGDRTFSTNHLCDRVMLEGPQPRRFDGVGAVDGPTGVVFVQRQRQSEDRALDATLDRFQPSVEIYGTDDYDRFLAIRGELLDAIRRESEASTCFLEDMADTLLEQDIELPTSLTSVALATVGLGRRVALERRKRERYKEVIAALLEKIFDPYLSFRMLPADILDTMQAKGFDRSNITHSD